MTEFCSSCNRETFSTNGYCQFCGKVLDKGSALDQESDNSVKNKGRLSLPLILLYLAIYIVLLTAILWSLSPTLDYFINKMIIGIVIFAILLIIPFVSGLKASKFILILFTTGAFISLFLFNLIATAIAVVGIYFSLSDVDIDSIAGENYKRNIEQKYAPEMVETRDITRSNNEGNSF